MKTRSVKRNALLNIIKQICAIIFPMITFPYAFRVLGVNNYGKYTFSWNVVNYISYLAAAGILRYAVRECARVRDDKDKLSKLINELYSINIITTAMSFLILFALLIFVDHFHDYAPFILVLSVSVLFTTIGTDWINSAFEDYFFITIRYIIAQTVALGLLFVLVRNRDDILGYSIVSVTGVIIANFFNYFHIRKNLGIKPKFLISKDMKKHIKPIMYFFACSIATFIYINSDISIIKLFFPYDDSHNGLYGAATRFYQLIKEMINAAFVVIIPRISNDLVNDKEKANSKLSKVLNFTILLTVPCSVGLFMVREDLIMIFSGAEFAGATTALGILAFSLAPALLANFYINIVMIPFKMEKKVTIATLISAAVNIGLNFVLIPLYAENAAAFTTLLAETSLALMGLYYARKIKIGNVSKSLVTALTGSGLIFVICFSINNLIKNRVFNFVLDVVLSGIAYVVVFAIFYNKDIKEFLKKRKR